MKKKHLLFISLCIILFGCSKDDTAPVPVATPVVPPTKPITPTEPAIPTKPTVPVTPTEPTEPNPNLVTEGSADFNTIPVPLDAPEGMKWEYQADISDDFNYTAPGDNKGATFNSKWKDSYVNGWTGEPTSVWTPSQSNVKNGYLNIEADRTPGTTDKIFCGNISARKSIIYPVYVEANLKMNQLPMGSDFWMISQDQTQEIDILEAFGTTRPEYNWFSKRLHLSHHTFDRTNGGFKDYQPSDENGIEGTWYHRNDVARWSASEFTLGVYWRDPFHLEYYLNGKWIRTMDKNSYSYLDPSGQKINKTTTFNTIDKFNYTKGTGLNKPMFLLIDTGIQPWTKMTVTTEELNDPVKSVYKVNWVRAYKPVNK